jgi:WD40 repeat protein
LAVGIEAGHGARDYLIDVGTGNSKPITPEGVQGATVSPDGRSVAVTGPDGKWGIWPLNGGALRPLPLDSSYNVAGWAPDGSAIYVTGSHTRTRATLDVLRMNLATGKLEPWKTFGDTLPTGAHAFGPLPSADGSAYIYGYVQVLSQAYVVKGLK